MKNRKTKKASSLIVKKTVVISIAVVLSVFAFLLPAYCLYGSISGGYHNDDMTPLYSVSGKCTAIDHKQTGRHTSAISTSFQIFTIEGKEYTLCVDDASYTSPEDYTLFEEKALVAEYITVQYVVTIDGDAIVQGLEIPGDRQYVDLEEVKKSNYLNSNIGFCTCLFFYAAVQILIIFFTRFKLKELPSIKTALRRAKRKKERAEQMDS